MPGHALTNQLGSLRTSDGVVTHPSHPIFCKWRDQEQIFDRQIHKTTKHDHQAESGQSFQFSSIYSQQLGWPGPGARRRKGLATYHLMWSHYPRWRRRRVIIQFVGRQWPAGWSLSSRWFPVDRGMSWASWHSSLIDSVVVLFDLQQTFIMPNIFDSLVTPVLASCPSV